MNIMLIDTNGQIVLPEGNDRELTLPETLKRNPTQPLVYGGFTLIGTDAEQPIYLCLPGDSNDVCNCAILASELVSAMTRMELPNADKEQIIRSILREELDGSEMETLAIDHNISLEQERCVLLLRLHNVDTETVLNILTNVIGDNRDDALIEIDRHTIALVKKLDETSDFEDVEQLGQAISNTFASETQNEILIGIGDPKSHLSNLGESMREARTAIEVGRVYQKNQNVFMYRKMIIERFLSEIPQTMSQKYYSLLFNRKTSRLFNDEMLHTIEKFFENSLNLSETARQLYIHRNTLIYRLDKVQRNIGLDLRAFDDAVTFKMMMLLGKSDHDKNRRNN
ncbi:MAG: helix-turn-helix domain-containing protein [Clostridia bacterium]|nr:helix-turn-helix domain-containing protein [Clostridia bacterium]